MKSPEIEVINRDNVPTPYQLRRLAMVGAKTAMQRQTLKRMAHRTDAYFFIDEVDYLNGTEVLEAGRIRHRMAARLGKKAVETGFQWSFKCYDMYWVEQETDKWMAERTLYRFEWQPQQTLVADRAIKIIGDQQAEARSGYDMGDTIDHFAMDDDAASILHAQMEFEAVTSDDCVHLISAMERYYAHLREHEIKAA